MDEAYYDARETRDPQEREADLFARLPAQIAHAKAKAPYFAALLAEVDPAAVADRAALAALPLTRKSALIDLQRDRPPFGGLAAEGVAIRRMFCSPGPIYEPEGRVDDYWRMARALYAAGFRKDDILHNTFAYHLTPAGAMVESGARAIGCTVVPGGVGNTEHQAAAMAHLGATGYVGTPSFLRILLERADEDGLDLSRLSKALVSGEALTPALAATFKRRGIGVFQCYATADIGLIAYETPAREGMVIDEDVIVEIVTPGTGTPVPEGEVGEVVVTVFSEVYPLIRFATGDLSAILPGPSPCGRTNARLRGWLGRADQTTKVKGMFVHPEQIAAVVARHPEIVKARLVVDQSDGVDVMTLRCEVEGAQAGLAAAIAETLHAVCKLKGRVETVAPGSLPKDGKVIDDVRKLV